MIALLLVFSLSDEPQRTIRERHDVVEVNHYYDTTQDTRLVFVQIIWWDWDARRKRYIVCDWRMLHRCTHPVQDDRRYVCLWRDGTVLREVSAPVRVISHTAYDKELADRANRHPDDRLKLKKAR